MDNKSKEERFEKVVEWGYSEDEGGLVYLIFGTMVLFFGVGVSLYEHSIMENLFFIIFGLVFILLGIFVLVNKKVYWRKIK